MKKPSPDSAFLIVYDEHGTTLSLIPVASSLSQDEDYGLVLDINLPVEEGEDGLRKAVYIPRSVIERLLAIGWCAADPEG